MSRVKVTAEQVAEYRRRGLVAAEPRRDPAYSRPGPWTLTIPGWHPTPLNDLVGAHRMKAHRLKSADARRVADEAELAKIPRAFGKRRVRLRIVLGRGQRGCDGDAYWKSLLDALVACHRLYDDSRQWCELTAVEFDRGKKATVIVLEDIRQEA